MRRSQDAGRPPHPSDPRAHRRRRRPDRASRDNGGDVSRGRLLAHRRRPRGLVRGAVGLWVGDSRCGAPASPSRRGPHQHQGHRDRAAAHPPHRGRRHGRVHLGGVHGHVRHRLAVGARASVEARHQRVGDDGRCKAPGRPDKRCERHARRESLQHLSGAIAAGHRVGGLLPLRAGDGARRARLHREEGGGLAGACLRGCGPRRDYGRRNREGRGRVALHDHDRGLAALHRTADGGCRALGRRGD
mmetsp:Transcript_99111/g.285957  ORF Transcript_99111/g.285957 Transcript_99111/m.285957 type:complete len:245 (-) Transcript_99111:2260-2994(-)